MGGPLDGIRVIELAAWQQGTEPGAMLADLGAEVIKVERPLGGDPSREIMKTMSTYMLDAAAHINYYFETHNRNKKGIAVDLGTDEGRKIIYKLVDKSDVFITNFLPDSLQRLRVDYDNLFRLNPRLVYGIASAYGIKGPERNREGYDLSGQARSGVMTLIGGELGQPPRTAGMGTGDQMGATMLAYAIMIALFVRERTGLGQLVSSSILGSMIWVQSHNMQAHLFTGQQPKPILRADAINPFWNIYRTKDDRWLILAMTQSEEYWHGLCTALDVGDLEDNPRFDTHEKRLKNGKVLISIMEQVFVTKELAEWVKRLEQSKQIFAPVNAYADVVADRQVWENEYVIEDVHPTLGPVKALGLPIYLSRTPGKVRTGAPQLGQHTEEVLSEICKYTRDEIVKLRDDGVIV